MVRINNHKKITIIVTLCIFFSLSAQNRKVTNIKATYYHDRFENRNTSSGEKFSQKLYTAAHKTLPFNTIVKITNPKTSRYVLVKINDRCARAGVIDLSKTAAKRVDLLLAGVCTMQMEIMPEEYRSLWERQTEIFAMFESMDMTIEEQKNYMDSLYNTALDIEELDMVFFIKIATVSSKAEAENLLLSLSEDYKKRSRYEKIYNENFYNVFVGPFANKEIAITNLNKLRRRYASAHIIKKKNE
ncbi:MAG: septal ring lytic transglycosylase RlpA family protein [Bacteroidota bacterium]|nr:septal ring lytic transglycosylase RlpA family protein [Bacteroidota bacterium]